MLVSTDTSRQYRVSCDQNNAAHLRFISVSHGIENPFSTPCQTLSRSRREMRYSPESIRRAVFWKVSGIFCDANGNRLNLNWNERELNCDNWNDDDNANNNVGVFALMMGKGFSYML